MLPTWPPSSPRPLLLVKICMKSTLCHERKTRTICPSFPSYPPLLAPPSLWAPASRLRDPFYFMPYLHILESAQERKHEMFPFLSQAYSPGKTIHPFICKHCDFVLLHGCIKLPCAYAPHFIYLFNCWCIFSLVPRSGKVRSYDRSSFSIWGICFDFLLGTI